MSREKYVYLDTNALIYMCEDKESITVEEVAELLNKKQFRLVISLFHIADLVTYAKTKKEALEIADIIGVKLQPMFIYDTLALKKWELLKFLKNNYSKENYEFNPMTEFLCEVDRVLLNRRYLEVGLNLKHFVNTLFANQDFLQNECFKGKNSLGTLLQGRKQTSDSAWEDVEKEVWGQWIAGLLKRIGLNNIQEMFKYCVENRKILEKQCPVLTAESILTKYRTTSTKRTARENDIYDLHHASSAIGYCDYFITNDGHLYNAAQYVKKHTQNKKIKIFRKTDDLLLTGK